MLSPGIPLGPAIAPISVQLELKSLLISEFKTNICAGSGLYSLFTIYPVPIPLAPRVYKSLMKSTAPRITIVPGLTPPIVVPDGITMVVSPSDEMGTPPT